MGISAIVLAAGASRRMGDANKLLLPWRGRPLIAHVVDVVARSRVDEVIVVLGHQEEVIREALPEGDWRIVVNPDWEDGMTTTIAAGVRAAAPDAQGYVICLCDLPLLEPADFNHLLTAFEQGLEKDPRCIGVPFYAGKRGNPVLFSAAWREAILAQKGLMGCRGLVKDHPEHVLPIEAPNDHVIRDMDTPEAYRALCE